MGVVTRSLWLPVGPANFYSAMSDPVLLIDDRGACRSTRSDENPAYIPFLRESVMRRLIEVLPASFGYDRTGECRRVDERPVELTLTLRPRAAEVRLVQGRQANQSLVEAGVDTVVLRVDEFGFYSFTAEHSGPSTSDGSVGDALLEHMVAVFGGTFEVNRLEPTPDRRGSEGAEAVRRYNGLSDSTPPLGALSFHQLNLMIEGLCNQSLLPAVFFEHYPQARRWLNEFRRKSSVLTDLGDFVREIAVPADASVPAGQLSALHRFLIVSRGSLQWMRRSVESVRRSLLDQMMAVSHRQARLIQLDLSGIDYERTPEMTGEATESQMRGYVMLVATKLPLMFSIGDSLRDASSALDGRVPDGLRSRMAELAQLVGSWAALLERLQVNVGSLETAVEHDWQERLLYEQEQARSEQEAMAEIERSRRGKPESRRMGDAAYNAIMLILTAVAVFVAIQAADSAPSKGLSLWEQAIRLWPVAAVSAVFFLAWPAIAGFRRLFQQRKPNSDSYSFEFAFRLDERATAERVNAYLSQRRPQRIRSQNFRTIKLRRLGGWRVERISTDTTLLKVHSVAVVRLRFLRFARFEIVTEIMIRRISEAQQYFVRQCRMFGDSPVPVESQRVVQLVGELLEHTCDPLAIDFDVKELIDPIALLQGARTWA